MELSHKLVALLNKDVPTGVAMNALAHMSIGLGAQVGKDDLLLDNYQDKDGNIYPNISKIPFIILRGKSSEIRKTVKAAREQNILHGAFINTMTGGGYAEQIANTLQIPEEQLVYYGVVLYGSIEAVNSLTRKFSLWRDEPKV